MFENFIAIGIIISLIYYELTGESPGGVVTPGYLALYVDQPLRILATIIVAAATCVLVHFLKRYLSIYGRRQFALAVTIAILIKMVFLNTGVLGGQTVLMDSIGVIVPGLLANDMVKQTVAKTLKGTTLVTVLMYGILLFLNGSIL